MHEKYEDNLSPRDFQLFFIYLCRSLDHKIQISMTDRIKTIISDSIDTKKRLLDDVDFLNLLEDVVQCCIKAFQADKKIFFCGNGGSAADAQHIAAELSGRFYKDREPLFAEALHVNTSYLTSVANDYSYNEVFARLAKAKCRQGDILFGISTSGNSQNVLLAFEEAKKRGATCIALTGSQGGKMANQCDFLLNVPSKDTPRIQEAHIMIGHIICELIEQNLFE